MTATEVLNRLDKLGVTAWPNSGNIRFQPASRVPPGLKAQIKEHKPEILILLLDQAKRGDGQLPPLDRPPQNEQELRRWMDHTADPEAFAQWLEWAMNYTDPVEDSPCPEDTPSG